jgi:hypothetical protein
MKKLLFTAAVALLIYGFFQEWGVSIRGVSFWTQPAESPLQGAFQHRLSGLQVEGEGVVTKILADDLEGSWHQRFILELPHGQTVLVGHNIDIAPRIERLGNGDTVAFHGVYEWNEKGGVIHWTHHDPDGRHIDGWLKHDGITYE